MCAGYFRKTLSYLIDIEYFNDLTTVTIPGREMVHLKKDNKNGYP